MRGRYISVLLVLFGGCLLLAGCGDKVSAPTPARTPAPAFPVVPESHIRLRLSVSTQALAARLNRMTQTKLLEVDHQKVKCGIGKCHLSVLATRQGQIRLDGSPDGLHIHLPFDAVAHMRLPGLFFSVSSRVHVTGTAEIVTHLSLSQSGHVLAHSVGDIRLSGGNLRLGPVRTSLADVWNANADRLSKPIFREMDKKFPHALNSRTALEKLWREAFRPVKAGHSPNAWLQLRPERLAVGRFRATDGTLSLPLGLNFQARLMMQDAKPETHATAMPALVRLADGLDSYAVYMPVQISYAEAANLAQKAIVRHPPHIAGYRITVRGLKMLPSGKDVLVRAAFCASRRWDLLHLFSACGVVWFRGVPYYDAKNGQIRIRDLHYDLRTKNLMLKTVQALAGEGFSRALEKSVHLNMSGRVGKVRQHLQRAFAVGTKGSVHLSGTLEAFTPYALHWTSQGFVALVRARGKAQLELQP